MPASPILSQGGSLEENSIGHQCFDFLASGCNSISHSYWPKGDLEIRLGWLYSSLDVFPEKGDMCLHFTGQPWKGALLKGQLHEVKNYATQGMWSWVKNTFFSGFIAIFPLVQKRKKETDNTQWRAPFQHRGNQSQYNSTTNLKIKCMSKYKSKSGL